LSNCLADRVANFQVLRFDPTFAFYIEKIGGIIVTAAKRVK
jgi:hypothetical protein